MLLKALPFVLIIGTALALPVEVQMQADRTLMDFMMMSTSRASDPALQAYCFGRYMPILNQINDEFEKEYTGCQDVYDATVKLIDSDFTEQRQNATAISKESCQSLQLCDGIDSYIKSFECFASTGAEQSDILKTMSGNAKASAAKIQERYFSVGNTRDQCFIDAQNVYSAKSTDAYNEMFACLDGNIVTPEPTNPPTAIIN
ncbi:hypothetical protein ACLKA7_011269 [Drosophila subpalustris]